MKIKKERREESPKMAKRCSSLFGRGQYCILPLPASLDDCSAFPAASFWGDRPFQVGRKQSHLFARVFSARSHGRETVKQTPLN
jgi:hypothetical protein